MGGEVHMTHSRRASPVQWTTQERVGYSLHLAPSAVGDADAGDGVWLCGRAAAGAVVGLYPGVVYTRTHYRQE